jgi:hypothetical protein
VKYWPRVLIDHPRSMSPATMITRPAANAAAPGLIAAAGTMCSGAVSLDTRQA